MKSNNFRFETFHYKIQLLSDGLFKMSCFSNEGSGLEFLDQNFLPNIISDIIAYIIFYRLDIVAVFSICHFVHYIHQVFSSFFEKWPKFLIELSHIFKAQNTLWNIFFNNFVRKGGQVFVFCRLVQLSILIPTDHQF